LSNRAKISKTERSLLRSRRWRRWWFFGFRKREVRPTLCVCIFSSAECTLMTRSVAMVFHVTYSQCHSSRWSRK